ncbi:MAG TPA: styrene monooxygenase/indole monooxygenase family protein [Thermoanaerobaculia bacterium]|nr:styrene monooxygenase/indole monooxygenase family protein [Thermoanaerobaculia bacterium]
MRRIAIIGSGQAGLLTAHGLLKAGYPVTLFSDRTPEQWLWESRPTGTAGRFEMALSYERELGLDDWEDVAPHGRGVHLTFCPKIGNRLVTLAGQIEDGRHFLAIDLRLQSHRWMKGFEARGGELVIETVGVERLDDIAAAHDLTIVAAGKAELARVFERDASRSPYETPQRNLAMVIVKGLRMGFEGVPYLPVKFNLIQAVGEGFWVPYHHRDLGPTWNLVFEAIPGGPADRFQGARTGREAVEIARGVIRDLFPWDAAWADGMELADDNGWLVGRFAPVVKKPVGQLPSGRIVTGVGDTLVLLDPVSGQGANSGNKMARNLVESIAAHGDRPFDAAWMATTFETYWRRHGQPINDFNNLFLEPITPAAQELLIAQYGVDGRSDDPRQAIADAFITAFDDPARLIDQLLDLDRSRAFIQETTGRPWLLSGISGRARIALGQLRQKLGLPPNHPRAEVSWPPETARA